MKDRAMYDSDARKIRFVALDFETTGRDPLTSRVTEVGIITYENGVEIDRWGQLVDPGEMISEEVIRVTGITNEHVKGMPTFAAIADEIERRVAGEYFLAYNASYDTQVMRAEMGRLGRTVEFKGVIDPLPFCWQHIRRTKKTTNARLGTICEYLGIELENAHRATDDAAAAAQVYLRLFDEVPELPATIGELLEVQAALAMEMEASFRRPRSGPSINMSDVNLEFGPAFVRGQISDPLRYLFRRLPDVRNVR